MSCRGKSKCPFDNPSTDPSTRKLPSTKERKKHMSSSESSLAGSNASKENGLKVRDWVGSGQGQCSNLHSCNCGNMCDGRQPKRLRIAPALMSMRVLASLQITKITIQTCQIGRDHGQLGAQNCAATRKTVQTLRADFVANQFYGNRLHVSFA